MIPALQELLFHPGIFFARKVREETSLVIPVFIIFIGGIVGLLAPYIGASFLSSLTGTGTINMIGMSFLIFPSLLLPFVAWILISGILFVLCRLFSGTGSFVATLQNTGYGALPLTISSIFGIITIAPTMEIPHPVTTGILLVFVTLVFAFVIWSGWLWAYAMEKTHAISHGRAIVAATIVVVLYLGLTAINILAALWLMGIRTA